MSSTAVEKVVRRSSGEALSIAELIETSRQRHGFVGLHLGCGTVRLDGFLGLDIDKATGCDVCVDLALGLPGFPDESVDLIHSEHLWEHLDEGPAAQLTRDCLRVLRPGARMRIATPDLDYLAQKYLWDWREQAWLYNEPWRGMVKTRGQMLNRAMRDWGHVFIFNEEDLTNLLRGAGFEGIKRYEFGVSADRRLWNREIRADSTLIMEATRPTRPAKPALADVTSRRR